MMAQQSYTKPRNMNELAHRIAELGYHPVPIQPGRKGPTFANWQNYEATAETIDRDFPAAGIVIGCLHDNLGCIDIDVYDAAMSKRIADEFRRRFPDALERVGQAPKTAFVFRLPETPYTVTNTGKYACDGVEGQVEIRTKTGQMVVYGKHPQTNMPYTWPTGDLWETPIDSLPMPGSWEIEEFRDWAEMTLKQWGDVDDQAHQDHRQQAMIIDFGAYTAGHDGPPSEAAILDALSYISPLCSHDDWVEVLMALHDYYNGSEAGLSVAQNWSAPHSNYNAREVVSKWRSFKGSGVSYTTLFHHAKMNGADLSEMARKHRPAPPTPQEVLAKPAPAPTPMPEQYAPQIAMQPTPQPEEPQAKPRAAIFWAGDARPVLSSSYLIKGWLGSEQMSVLYGPSNVGKSFFALDMAFHIAAGKDWQGCKVKQGTVLYLATEGGNAFQNRVYALMQEHGLDNVALAVRAAPVDLLRPEADLKEIAGLCDEIAAEHGDIVLIVIDTLSRAMAGGNENGPEDMTAFINNVDALRHYSKSHAMTVHHSGKDTAQGARGHSSLRAATDTEIELENIDGLRMATATKQRDVEPKKPIAFSLKVHKLGDDTDGDPVTTCTIEAADQEDVDQAKMKKPKGKNQAAIIRAFTQMRQDGIGQPNTGGTGWPDGGKYWIIDAEDFANFAKGKLGGSNPRGAFKQAYEALIGIGYMTQNDGYCWISAKEGRI